MLVEAEGIFKLSDEPGSLGLSCNKEGVVLAGVPLLSRAEAGFAPRPESEIRRLLGEVYGDGFPVEPVISGLGVAAKALNSGDLPRAMIAAVQLKLPSLDWHRAVRMAQADDALSKYSPDQPRDWHGRWTTGAPGGGASPDVPHVPLPQNAGRPTTDSATTNSLPVTPADQPLALPKDWVQLPPGNRIDELGALLEWIANANRAEESDIRAEIKRLYYDVGDLYGGNALNQALSQVLLDWPLDRNFREEIINDCDKFTHVDPAEFAQFMQAAIGMALLAPGIRAVLPDAPQVARSEAWKLGWAARGKYFNDALGAKLPDNYPVIDDFSDGIVTSNKSIDLEARSYQNSTVLRSQIRRYIDQVAEFDGSDRRDFVIKSSQIRGRALTLVIPRGSGSRVQQPVIGEAKAYAKERGVEVTIVPF